MAGKAKKISIKSWFRRFGVQISMFYLAAGLMIVMALSGTIYFFAANLMMDETVLKTRDQLEMSGANICGGSHAPAISFRKGRYSGARFDGADYDDS